MCSADRGARLPRSQAAMKPARFIFLVVAALLLKGARVNEKDEQGQTALMRAAEQGQLAVCKALAGPGGALPGSEGAAKALLEEAKKRGLELQQPGLPLSRLAPDLNDK